MTPIDATSAGHLGSPRARSDAERPVVRKSFPEPGPNTDIGAAVESINRYLRQEARDVQFSVDRSTGKTVVRVVNAGSGEIIRQIPTEEALEIARAINLSIGLFLNEKA